MKDFLITLDGKLHCKGQDAFRSNKKIEFCSNCVRAFPCDNGTVCPHGLDINF